MNNASASKPLSTNASLASTPQNDKPASDKRTSNDGATTEKARFHALTVQRTTPKPADVRSSNATLQLKAGDSSDWMRNPFTYSVRQVDQLELMLQQAIEGEGIVDEEPPSTSKTQ